MKLPDIPHYAPGPAEPEKRALCKNCGRGETAHITGPDLVLFCEVATAEQTQHAFHAINQEGCARFDTRWIATNHDVVRLAHLYGLDPSEPALRAVLVTLAYELCAKEQATTEGAP